MIVQSLIADGPASYLTVDDSVQDKRYAKKIEFTEKSSNSRAPKNASIGKHGYNATTSPVVI